MERQSGATFDESRRIFEDWLSELAIPEDARFEPVEIGGVPCIWAEAPGIHANRVVIHFHSGGYLLGSANGYRSFGTFLSAASGCRVLLPDYRLAPEHPYPAAIEDALTVYEAVVELGHAPSQIAFCGDSAGGGLVFAALQAMRDRGVPFPAAAVSISPLADFTHSGESYRTNAAFDPLVTLETLKSQAATYCEGHDPRSPGLSPLFGEWSNLPPLLILAGEIEMMRDDGKRCAEAAAAAGVNATYLEGAGMMHIWTLFADRLPEAREALEQVGSFIKAYLRNA